MGLVDVFKKPFEWLIDGIASALEYFWERTFSSLYKEPGKRSDLTHSVSQEVTGGTVKEDRFRTDLFKKELPKIKEKIRHSPQGVIDYADAFLAPFIGKGAPEVLLEKAGINVEEMPISVKGIIDVMNTQADMALLTGYVDIAGDLSDLIHLKHIGRLADRVVRDSGMPEMAGFTFGQSFGNAIGPPVQYAVNRQLKPIVPNPPDLVRFLVKEVYAGKDGEMITTEKELDEITERVKGETNPANWVKYPTWRGKQLVPYPPEFWIDWMAAHGYDRHFAEDLWAQHWEEPSYRRSREMYARLGPDILEDTWRDYTDLLPEGVEKTKENVLKYVAFDSSDLRRLLRFRDINPYWRSKLAAIAYRPYTRVDIRRMYEAGTFTEEVGDVQKAVDRMAETDPQFKDVYRAMREIRFPPEKAYYMAKFYVRWASKDIRDTHIDMTLEDFRKGIISEEEARTHLEAIDVRPAKIDALIEQAKWQGPPSLPTKKELQSWFTGGLIDETKVREYLSYRGYAEEDIDLYIKTWSRKGAAG